LDPFDAFQNFALLLYSSGKMLSALSVAMSVRLEFLVGFGGC
jgi:hypothetical protein